VEVTWALIVESWKLSDPDKIGLLDVVHNVQPTVLIGVSGQAGAFSERIVHALAECNKRPVIFPLSNPILREKATAAARQCNRLRGLTPPVSARKTPPRTENPDNPKPASASPSRTLLTAGNGFEHQRLRMAGLRSSRHWRGQLCYVRRPHSGARYVSCSSDEHLRRRICSVLVSRRL
jgi:hypothetical protein